MVKLNVSPDIESNEICDSTKEALISKTGRKIFKIFTSMDIEGGILGFAEKYYKGEFSYKNNVIFSKLIESFINEDTNININGKNFDEILDKLVINNSVGDTVRVKKKLLSKNKIGNELIKIKGVKTIKKIFNIKLNQNGQIVSGKIEDENGKTLYFWFENGEYITISDIKGVTKIKKLAHIQTDENGKILYGEVENEKGHYIPFNLDNGYYTALRINGIKEITGTGALKRDSYGKILYGEVKDENGIRFPFRSKSGEYVALTKIKGVNKIKLFTYIERDKLGKVTIGTVKDDNGTQLQFWFEDGEYVALNKIKGIKQIKSITNVKREGNGKIISGKVKNEEGKWFDFYLEKGIYKIEEKGFFDKLKNFFK